MLKALQEYAYDAQIAGVGYASLDGFSGEFWGSEVCFGWAPLQSQKKHKQR